MNHIAIRRLSNVESFIPPNLLFRKAKTEGKNWEQIALSSVPVPKLRGEALFGVYPILEALRANRRTIHNFYMKSSVRKRDSDDRIDEILQLLNDRRIAVKRLTQSQLDKMTSFQLHNGLCMDCSSLEFSPVSIPNRIALFLDNVLDPVNVGAIARNAFFFGASSISYINGPNSLSPSMSKSSCGALEWLPISRISPSSQFFSDLIQKDVLVIGSADIHSANRLGKKTISIKNLQLDPSQRILLVLGDEGKGISEDILSKCQVIVSISSISSSSLSSITSLNVSVVSAILLHHITSL